METGSAESLGSKFISMLWGRRRKSDVTEINHCLDMWLWLLLLLVGSQEEAAEDDEQEGPPIPFHSDRQYNRTTLFITKSLPKVEKERPIYLDCPLPASIQFTSCFNSPHPFVLSEWVVIRETNYGIWSGGGQEQTDIFGGIQCDKIGNNTEADSVAVSWGRVAGIME